MSVFPVKVLLQKRGSILVVLDPFHLPEIQQNGFVASLDFLPFRNVSSPLIELLFDIHSDE